MQSISSRECLSKTFNDCVGKPRRTSLKSNGHSGNPPRQSSLQWTYQWTINGSSPAVLQVEFEAKTPDVWQVNSWGWTSY